MPDDFKPVLSREMEVYAGYLEYTDHHVGRIVEALEKLKILDDTLDLLHLRRQRRLSRGIDQRLLQRNELFQRPAVPRNT